MRRVGLGRRRRIGDLGEAGDPLEGIVNLFDIGIVLAAAALIAAIGVTGSRGGERPTRAEPATTTPLTAPARDAPRAAGPGEEVGKVYRLADGRLVYVEP